MSDKKIVPLCGAELEQLSKEDNWIDVVSGDDGGTYDYCPESPHEEIEDKLHKPKAVPR